MQEEMDINIIKAVVSPVFHATAFVHHMYALIYPAVLDFNSVTDQRVLDIAFFAPIFITSWNMIIQTVYFGLACYYDFLKLTSLKPKRRKKIELYNGYIFTSLMFPCSLFVCLMFWGVYSWNRELVHPEVLDDYIPNWLNHFLHTNIMVFAVIEILLTNQLLPTFKSAFIGITIFSATYHALFLLAYAVSGRWAYGLFYKFTWPERIMFMFLNYIFVIIVMTLGLEIERFKHNLSSKNVFKKIEKIY